MLFEIAILRTLNSEGKKKLFPKINQAKCMKFQCSYLL